MEKLKRYDLNCNIFDVYDYDGLSMQELLCQFFTKINECVDFSNSTLDLCSWLVNEGLKAEVSEKLATWLNDGTLENIINENLFNDLYNKFNELNNKIDTTKLTIENKLLKHYNTSSTSYISKSNYSIIEGMENLYKLHMCVGGGENCKIIFSGDSTTYGYGLTEPHNYSMDNIFKYTCNKEGLFNIETVNCGYNSLSTEHWSRSKVDDEIKQNPTCIVLRWGLNEPSYDKDLNLLPENGISDNRRNENDFKTSLESGLRKLREWKGVSELTIILMSPNSTSNDLSFRNEQWHEKINPIIRELAYKYKCVFIDTYRFLQDTRDVPFMDRIGDGHIHPFDMMNVWINDLLFDTCFKTTYKHQYSYFNKWKSVELLNNWNGDIKYKWIDYNTIEFKGLINGGNTTPLSTICKLPLERRCELSIKTVSTEVGHGCLNAEGQYLRVGNLYNISNSNWVSLDGVRIYLND